MFCFFTCVFVDFFFFLICLKILCRTAGRVIDTISRMEPSRFFNISSEKTSNESDFLLACHCISITIALRVNFKVFSGIKFCGYRVHLKKILVLHKSFDKILFLAIVLKIISIIIFVIVNNS